MNHKKRILIVMALLAAPAILAQDGSNGGVAPVKMTAKKYEFDPGVIKVKKGDHVRLEITSVDHEHGIKIPAFHVEQKLPKGKAVTVEFTADQTGTFPFECSHFCGLGHGKMKGQLIVE